MMNVGGMEYVWPCQLHIVHIWHLITCSDPVWTEFFNSMRHKFLCGTQQESDEEEEPFIFQMYTQAQT